MALLAATHPERPSHRRPRDAEPFACMEVCEHHNILSVFPPVSLSHRDPICIALGGELDRHQRGIQDVQYCRAEVDSLGTQDCEPFWCLAIDVELG